MGNSNCTQCAAKDVTLGKLADQVAAMQGDLKLARQPQDL
jgi:hypothetical protein